MIIIKDHLIDGNASGINCKFEETPNHSGLFGDRMPDTIVIHYTAGGTYTSSVNWLINKDAQASAHLVIGKKGEVVQLVPFNVMAWHAGKSEWKGRQGLNRYSIGIEIANAGKLEKRANGYYTSFGAKVADDNVVLAKHKHGTTEEAWEAYTAQQIETVENICLAIKEAYNITEIVGHEDIAPARKTDPGPAYPMDSLRNRALFGRKEANDTIIEEGGLLKGIVTADYLNIRRNPNIDAPTVAEPLPQGTRLAISKIDGQWAKVKIEIEGWVSKNYIKHFE